MPVYLLFRYTTIAWDMVVLDKTENATEYYIDPNSRFFVIEYATAADSQVAINRVTGVVPYAPVTITGVAATDVPVMQAAYAPLLLAIQ